MTYAAFPVPADLAVTTPEGDLVPVSGLVTGRLLVVQLVRYFGCLPCQDRLMQLDKLAPSLSEHGLRSRRRRIGGLPGAVAARRARRRRTPIP